MVTPFRPNGDALQDEGLHLHEHVVLDDDRGSGPGVNVLRR